MGFAKRQLEEAEHLDNMALHVLLESGALRECEHHDGVYYDGGAEVEGAYRLANSQITSHKITLPDGVSRKDFTDAIKAVYEDNYGPDGCYICEKNMSD
jgi:hypothetical protein